MLIAEYDYDTDIAVQRAEAGKIAFAQGISHGISQGISQGTRQKALQDASNFKRLGVSVDIISQATGLTVAEVEALG